MFTDAEKAEIENDYRELFDSFREQIAIYRTPKITYVSSGPNFNFAFGEAQPESTSQYVSQSGVFWATIQPLNQQDNQNWRAIDQNTPFKIPQGIINIRVSGSEAAAFLSDCEKIVFDGRDYKLLSDVVPRGMFSRNYFDCWVQRIDNGQV